MNKEEYSKQGKANKRKGREFERQVAKDIQRYFPHCKAMASPRSGGYGLDFPGDLVIKNNNLLAEFFWECKKTKRFEIDKWMKECDERVQPGWSPAIVMSHPGTTDKLVTMKFLDWLKYMFELDGYRNEDI